MFEKSIFSVVATQASSILIRSSKKKVKFKIMNFTCLFLTDYMTVAETVDNVAK